MFRTENENKAGWSGPTNSMKWNQYISFGSDEGSLDEDQSLCVQCVNNSVGKPIDYQHSENIQSSDSVMAFFKAIGIACKQHGT